MPPSPTPDEQPHTTQLHVWLARIEAGDDSAWDEMLRGVAGQLEQLARGMLRRFPTVGRWEQADDVLNSALVRLLRALREVRPESMRRFYGLAAEQIRRELIDLARHYRNARGDSAAYGPGGPGPAPEPPAAADPDFDRWCAFHEGVAGLPAEQREVVGLIFYHGRSHEEVAGLFGVSTRTVGRWWQEALLTLRGRRSAGEPVGPDA